MAIPWLIGAAVVGAATWLLSDSEEEKERKRREEELRIQEEAQEKRKRAKEANEKREKEAQARDLEQFAYVKGKSLADKYRIKIASADGVEKVFSIAKTEFANIETIGGLLGGLASGIQSLLPSNEFSQKVVYLAINYPDQCEQEFKRIFLQSSETLRDMDVKKAALESELLELNELSALLVNKD